MEQGILAALTLPVVEGETLDERAHRAARDSKQQVEDAAKRGVLMHKCVEEYLLFGRFDPHPSVKELMEPFPKWAESNISNVAYSERTLVGPGYAGTVDLKAELRGYDVRIMDCKSRKPYNGAIRTYPEDNIQLAAYYQADLNEALNTASYNPSIPKGTASIILNSVEPSEPVIHVWDEEEMKRGVEIFNHLLAVWCLMKNYYPVK